MNRSIERRIDRLEQEQDGDAFQLRSVLQLRCEAHELAAKFDSMTDRELHQLSEDESAPIGMRREALKRLVRGSEGQAKEDYRNTLVDLVKAEFTDRPHTRGGLLDRVLAGRLRVVAVL